MSELTVPFDGSRLLYERSLERIVPAGSVLANDVYVGHQGQQFRTLGRKSQLVQDVVRLTDEALLLASGFAPTEEFEQTQIVNDSDWIHIQFRLNGGGEERISNKEVIETPTGSCVVTRYPESSVINRRITAAGSYRVACLLLRPRALVQLLDVSPSSLPQPILWLGQQGRLALHASTIPLTAAMRLAANDVLSCSLRGVARGAYMRAKSLELLAMVVHTLHDNSRAKRRGSLSLSPLDVRRLNQVWLMIAERPEGTMTLAVLARLVGLNRTKLALGFKEMFGISVQAYWRDVRLDRARELLRNHHARVTDVALSLGYSELSSFTRAFNRKFGVLPRDVRNSLPQI